MKIKAGASHCSMVLVLRLENVKNEENMENIVRSNAEKKNVLLNGKVDSSKTR